MVSYFCVIIVIGGDRLTYKELLEKRKSVLAGSTKSVLYKRQSKRPKQERYCCVCGRKLTEYVSYNDSYVTLVAHYYLTYFNVFRPSICQEPRSCSNHLGI